MKNNEMKQKIRMLKKEKKYDEIFREFGKNVYAKNVPYLYRRKDIRKLENEGKYEDIFNKYGEKKYNKILEDIVFDEIKEKQGEAKAVLWRTKNEFKKLLKRTGIGIGLAASGLVLSIPTFNEANVKDNEIKYEQEIENYDEKIKAYAKEVNEMNLDDVHVFMKVMNDMWSQIQGYKNPEKDIQGFLELDLATENGYGVCRNMASDVARKLNEIDKKYNARTLNVAMGENGKYQLANIQRTLLEENPTVVEEAGNTQNVEEILQKQLSLKVFRKSYGYSC